MNFRYKAITSTGGEQVGKIDAESAEKAIEMLQKHKMVVTSIKSINNSFSVSSLLAKIKKVGAKKIVIFSKELAVLLTSGVSLVEALRIQWDQEDNAVFKDQIAQITEMVDDGDTFSNALSKFPSTFSNFYVNIVKSGEASGKLQESLMHLSDYVEKSYLLTSKVKSAMLYPCVILFGFLLVGIAMMVIVVPQLTAIFRDNQMELPLPTKILIGVSDFMIHYLVLVIIGLVALSYAFKQYIKTDEGRLRFDKLMITMPPFKELFRKYYIARFSDNLSILIGSGVPIVNALQISGDVAGNTVYKQIIYDSVEEVKIGGSIAYMFERSDYVPPMLSKMLKIGEKTGKIDYVLKDVADFYTKEVDIAVDGLTAVIEPILILLLGGGVGLLVAAIIMPIYQMTESI